MQDRAIKLAQEAGLSIEIKTEIDELRTVTIVEIRPNSWYGETRPQEGFVFHAMQWHYRKGWRNHYWYWDTAAGKWVDTEAGIYFGNMHHEFVFINEDRKTDHQAKALAHYA